MKKVFRNAVAAFAAVTLISAFASCSDGGDDTKEIIEDPIVDPIEDKTEEGEKTETIDNEDGSKTVITKKILGETVTFPVTVASTNAEDTVIFVKYDRTAAGADELITIENANLKIYVNDVESKTYDKITFALDEYGASFSGKTGQLTDKNDMKEYKNKLAVGKKVNAGDTVKVVLGNEFTITGAGKDKVDLTSVVVALVDKAEAVNYYKELVAEGNNYKPIIKIEEKAETIPAEKTEETKVEETPKTETTESGSDEEKKEEPKTEIPAVTKPANTVKEITTENNAYSTSKHGIQAKIEVRPNDELKGLAKDDKITVVMKGVSTKNFTPQFYFMDNTAAGEYSNLGAWGDKAELKTTGFEVTKEITIEKAPSSDENDALVFVIDYDEEGATTDLENVTIYFTEFSVSVTKAPTTGNSEGNESTETGSTEENSATTPTATEVFSGSKTIDWGDNALVIDHAAFTGDFNAVRITYNATAGALKMAVCDKWTVVTFTSETISAGILNDDGSLNVPTGDAQTVTINLPEDIVTGIKGHGNEDEGWGGLKIFGADTITITKVETVNK